MDLITIIGGIAVFSWLGVLGAGAFIFLKVSRGEKFQSGVVFLVLAIVIAIALNTASAGLVFIEPQRRGVVITIRSGGVKPLPLEPGLTWVIPYAESVVQYDMSNQTYTMSIAHSEGQIQGDDSVQSLTKDGQIVQVDASVIFRINPDTVVDLHKTWQSNYVDGLVRPEVRGIIRDIVATYNIEQVYSTERANMIQLIEDDMTEVMLSNGLVLESFVLRNISFTEEYAKSVEDKQIAEQLVLQKINEVLQAEQDALQARKKAEGEANAIEALAEGEAAAIEALAQANANARLIEAEAEAEALKLLAAAIKNNPDVLTLEYIQSLAPNIQVMLLPADSPFLFPLPEMQPETTP